MAMTAAGMMAKVKAAIAAVPAVQSGDPAAVATYRDAVLTAMCAGIIDEVVANSELVPVTTDTGPAGAGIITGKVK
jgi:copper(I)-binding protein